MDAEDIHVHMTSKVSIVSEHKMDQQRRAV